MAKNERIALEADPADADDFDVTEAALAAAQAERAARRRGRQAAPTKEPVSIRLDHDVVARLRASGPGWQSRINETLRTALGL